MLRKDRDKKNGIAKMKDPLETMKLDGEKKPTKRELAHRHFDTTRYRTLNAGDYVLAKPLNQEIWILARIVQDWVSPTVSFAELKKFSKVRLNVVFKKSIFYLFHNIKLTNIYRHNERRCFLHRWQCKM